MNAVLDTIFSRFSCRAYDGVLPEREKLETIAKAGNSAPTSRNQMPFRIHVLTDKALLDEMDADLINMLKTLDPVSYERMQERGGRAFYNAPCMYLVLIEEGKELDCGIVTQSIALAATSLGLDNVICGFARVLFEGPMAEKYRKAAKVPEGFGFGMSVLVGQGTMKASQHETDPSKILFV